MANTYTQIHIQAIVAVKFRDAVIMPQWKETTTAIHYRHCTKPHAQNAFH